MSFHDFTSIAHLLQVRQDGLDPQRESLRRDLAAGVPDARERTFALANAVWMRVAQPAWNEGDRSPATLEACQTSVALLDWAIQHEPVEGAPRFDLGGCYTTKAMLLHVLGESDDAIEILRAVAARPVNSYFHESGSEKLARILVDLNRTDEAVAVFEEILGGYPGNEYAKRCLEAFRAQTAGGGFVPDWEESGDDDDDEVFSWSAGEAPGGAGNDAAANVAAYEAESAARVERFQREVAELMQAGLDPAVMTERMTELQAGFQGDMEELARKMA